MTLRVFTRAYCVHGSCVRVQSADAPNAGAGAPCAQQPARDGGEAELLRRVRLLARTLLTAYYSSYLQLFTSARSSVSLSTCSLDLI